MRLRTEVESLMVPAGPGGAARADRQRVRDQQLQVRLRGASPASSAWSSRAADAGKARLRLWDDGKGMPRDRKAGTGLSLIEGFVRQIGGTAVWGVDGGTRLTDHVRAVKTRAPPVGLPQARRRASLPRAASCAATAWEAGAASRSARPRRAGGRRWRPGCAAPITGSCAASSASSWRQALPRSRWLPLAGATGGRGRPAPASCSSSGHPRLRAKHDRGTPQKNAPPLG